MAGPPGTNHGRAVGAVLSAVTPVQGVTAGRDGSGTQAGEDLVGDAVGQVGG